MRNLKEYAYNKYRELRAPLAVEKASRYFTKTASDYVNAIESSQYRILATAQALLWANASAVDKLALTQLMYYFQKGVRDYEFPFSELPRDPHQPDTLIFLKLQLDKFLGVEKGALGVMKQISEGISPQALLRALIQNKEKQHKTDLKDKPLRRARTVPKYLDRSGQLSQPGWTFCRELRVSRQRRIGAKLTPLNTKASVKPNAIHLAAARARHSIVIGQSMAEQKQIIQQRVLKVVIQYQKIISQKRTKLGIFEFKTNPKRYEQVKRLKAMAGDGQNSLEGLKHQIGSLYLELESGALKTGLKCALGDVSKWLEVSMMPSKMIKQ